VDGIDHFRFGKAEYIVTAPEIHRVVHETVSPEIRFRQGFSGGEPVRLNHGSHGAVQNKDTLGGNPVELFPYRGSWKGFHRKTIPIVVYIGNDVSIRRQSMFGQTSIFTLINKEE
jgi:hypothetical protein